MKKLIIFGTGDYYKKNKESLNNDEILAFADNNEKKIGEILDGKKIINPVNINKFEYDEIIIMSMFFVEIKEQLLSLGVEEDKISIWEFCKDNKKQVMKPYEVKIKKTILKNRKRIVHFIENFYTGGSTRLVVDLIENLGHMYEQKVFTLLHRDCDEFTNVDVSVINLSNKNQIIKKIKEYEPDIIHVHLWESEWYKELFNIIDEYKMRFDKKCKIIENINTPTYPITREYIDRYVFVSNYVFKEFHFNDGKSEVIYPGSDFEFFTRSLNEDYLNKDTIGMVYRLDYDKLSSESIDVFIKVVKRRPETKVIIVGGGPRYYEYVNKVKNEKVFDNFTFTGYVPYEELPRIYEKFTIFVAPVWKESFGQVTPFAMSMGIPITGYNIGALEEIIGNEKLLSTYGDVEVLSDIIINLLNNYDECIEIGRYNKIKSEENFGINNMIVRYDNLYKDLTIKR